MNETGAAATEPERAASLDEAAWRAQVYRGDVPQLTVRAVAVGSLLGFFLSFANVYIGLKTGWFLGVNLTACILTFAWSRATTRLGLARTPLSLLESACAVSTASSAGYATGNMVISALPAMLLLSVTEASPRGTQLPWTVIAAWVFCLAALGVAFAIPMKRSMVNDPSLPFPSATAAAATLQGLHSRGAEAVKRARALFFAAAAAALVPLLKDLEVRKVGVDAATGAPVREALFPSQSNVFDGLGALFAEPLHRMRWAGPPGLHPGGRPFELSDYLVKLDHGVALVFVGSLVGLRVTGWMVIGGLVFAGVITPAALGVAGASSLAHAALVPGTAWKEIGIWIGAPLLVSASLVGVAARWRVAGRALAAMVPDGRPRPKDDLEVPARWFVVGALSVAMTFGLAFVASRVTAESDVSPGGALGKLMQLTHGLLFPQSAVANLQTAAITAGASLASADLLGDLRCGRLLGAHPRRQFVAQALGIFTGTLASTLAYLLLVPDASALLGTASHPPAFPAIGAQQWKAVAEVMTHGIGSLHPVARALLPWGAVVGAVLGIAEVLVPPSRRRWVPSSVGLGLGLLLPFFFPLAMFLGAVAAAVITAIDARWAERYLVPIAAGGIAGEGVVGVLVQAANNLLLR
jgi:uncharacterized oligopeptide transporter (OPT) family protein